MEVILKTPRVPADFIYTLLEKKEPWIRKKLLVMSSYSKVEVSLEDEVLLFNELYSIDSHEATALRVSLEKIRVNSTQNILKHYNTFYKNISISYITPRVKHFADTMKLNYKEIKYKKMKSRWGSCSSAKVLTFNTELVKVKKELIDYVIVHELAHLKHMNHSKKFHQYVEEHLKNSELYKKELKSIRLPI